MPRHALLEGSAWEIQTTTLLNAMVKTSNFNTRVGAKKANVAERLQNPSAVLTGEDATSYRALAARANYLALDRPDIAFATTDLRRCFASPTRSSVLLL